MYHVHMYVSSSIDLFGIGFVNLGLELDLCVP